MRILGISAYYHDSAAALVADGKVVAAAQEERFTRKKHDSSFPLNAIKSCLDIAGIRPAQLDQVAFYDKPFLKFERLLETYLAFAPRGFRVGSPQDAFRCFMGTEIETLAIGNCLLEKHRQDPALKQSYESAFELD